MKRDGLRLLYSSAIGRSTLQRTLGAIVMAAAGLLISFSCRGESSQKRGLCWDEAKLKLGEYQASLLVPGVSWVYNWGPSPANEGVYSEEFCFVPMAWNGSYDAGKIKSWLKNHPETRYLLGFNEPNFASQAKMTPSQAASAWPGLEAIAKEFGVKLVAPALNFSDSSVGGKVWGIYDWYDEFFRLYPEAQVDCLALHCYMNWSSATTWFATEYIYKDLYTASNKSKYPNLVRFLDNFKEANGHFPRMMLTEFCGWEYDYLPDVYFQIDQMTQKVQKLEQSDLIEGYAWFIGNNTGGASSFPYMSVLQTNSATSQLSDLGKVYVNMSSFDKTHYYQPEEMIMAKDYVDASMDNRQVKVRPNTETGSSIPLQIELPSQGECEYLVEVSSAGDYVFTIHMKSDSNPTLSLSVDNKIESETTGEKGKGVWEDLLIDSKLTAGRHSVKIRNKGTSTIILNSLSFKSGSAGIEMMEMNRGGKRRVFNIQGIDLGDCDYDNLAPGLYLVKKENGETEKLLK